MTITLMMLSKIRITINNSWAKLYM